MGKDTKISFIAFLFILVISVDGKPNARSDPWDWQNKNHKDLTTFNDYEAQLQNMIKQPYFSKVNNKVTVNIGETAFLPCRVKDIREDNYMVTWMRLTDVTILSIGNQVFNSDKRLYVVHVQRPQINADDWTLILNKTSSKDSGKYECSVNTLPKISHVIDLTVTDPMDIKMQDSPYQDQFAKPLRVTNEMLNIDDFSYSDKHSIPIASIVGPRVHYVSSGSTVRLECKISYLSSPPLSLYWKKENIVLTVYQRPGLSLETEKLSKTSTSKLFLSNVTVTDKGNYSCVSDTAEPATVLLVVTNDQLTSPLVASASYLTTFPYIVQVMLFVIVNINYQKILH